MSKAEVILGALVVMLILIASSLFPDVGELLRGVALALGGIVFGRQLPSPAESRRKRSLSNYMLVLLLALPLASCAALPGIVTKVVDVAGDVVNWINAIETFADTALPDGDVKSEVHRLADVGRELAGSLSDELTSEELARIAGRLRDTYSRLVELLAPYGVQPATGKPVAPGTYGGQCGAVFPVPSVYGLIPPELGE
jgi:hypothetical protein